jgi:hypothetical protein
MSTLVGGNVEGVVVKIVSDDIVDVMLGKIINVVKKSQSVENVVVKIVLSKKNSNGGKIVSLIGVDDVVEEVLSGHLVSPYLIESVYTIQI